MHENAPGIPEIALYKAVVSSFMSQGMSLLVERTRNGILRISSPSPIKVVHLIVQEDHKLILAPDRGKSHVLFMEELADILSQSDCMTSLLIGKPQPIIWFPIPRETIFAQAAPAEDAIKSAKNAPGIYAIVRVGEIIYIGMSEGSLAKRLSYYRSYLPGSWQIASFAPQSGLAPRIMESLMIEVHDPQFNGKGSVALLAQAASDQLNEKGREHKAD